MIPEYQNKRTKRFIFILLAASFLIMFLVMFLMQAIKQMILPDMTLWESHWITNIFSALMAVIFAMFVIKYLNRYHSRISIEIEQKGILEKELKEAISILDAAIDSTEDGILIVNGEGKVSKSNKKFLELWNMPLSIMESKDDAPLLEYASDQLENPEIFLERVQALYKNPLEESFDELYFKDGKIFERYSKPQFVDNNVIGRVWSFRDVTEKKRAEERIKLFEHTIASVNEAVNITDLNDNLIYVNRAFCSTYGYKEEDLIGKHCSIFWSAKTPRDMLQKIRPETLYTGWSGEIDNKRKDGTEFPIHLSTSVIRDHNNKPIALVGIARDISEIKKEQLIQNILYKISQAVQSTESLKELFSRIHEIIKERLSLNNFYLALKDDQSGVISYPYFIDEDSHQNEPQKTARECTKYVLKNGEPELINKDRFVELAKSGEMEPGGIPAAIWLGIPLKVFNNIIGVMAVQDYNNPDAYLESDKEFLTIVSEQIAVAIYK